MKLFLVHCGFYDAELCDAVFEGHVNFFVAATSFEEARTLLTGSRHRDLAPVKTGQTGTPS